MRAAFGAPDSGSLTGVIRYFGQIRQNSSNRFLIAKLPDLHHRGHSFNSGTGSERGIRLLIVVFRLLSVLLGTRRYRVSLAASPVEAELPHPAEIVLDSGRGRQLPVAHPEDVDLVDVLLLPDRASATAPTGMLICFYAHHC
jgi:hypothetical protein